MNLGKFFSKLAVALIALALPCAAYGVNVLTYHNSNSRTGLNASETVLTPANVASADFGKVFSAAVDGYVYAQPLVMTGVSIAGQGVHDVVFVATEHNSVYAFDAKSGAQLWSVNLGPAAVTTIPGVFTNMNFGTRFGDAFTDIVPEVGITSTPVIDSSSGTIYVDAFTGEVGGGTTNYYHRIHALKISDGSEQPYSPVTVSASVPGNGVGSINGRVYFDAKQQLQRSALTLAGGMLYVAYASYASTDPYHGWVIGYRASDLAQLPGYVFNSTPNSTQAEFGDHAGEGGIWMAGCGPAVDAQNNLYFLTGNGVFNVTNNSGNTEYSDSILKLSTTSGLRVADYFTPWNQKDLELGDRDMASSGIVLLPDQSGAYPHLLLSGSKNGIFYMLNRDQFTSDNQHFNPSGNYDSVLQTASGFFNNAFGTPAYFDGRVYFAGVRDYLRSYAVNNGQMGSLDMNGAATYPYPGATPSISANGTANGIVWVLNNGGFSASTPAILQAFDAKNLSSKLFDSSLSGDDSCGPAVKFTVPTVANGKVYVGGKKTLTAYGLASTSPQVVATPVISPDGGVYNDSPYITISCDTVGATIYYTLDGSVPTTGSTRYNGAFTISDTATVKARAFKSGAQDSGVDTAAFTILQQVGDNTPPACAISAPYNGQGFSSGRITVTGVASDDSGVANVFYNLNDQGWNAANSYDGWNNWFADLDLSAGANTIKAFSTDLSGNQSPVQTVTVNLSAGSQLTVNVVGKGTVSPSYQNSSLQIGSTYSITATPVTGFKFVNWTDGYGSVLGTSTTLRFTMDWGLNLYANFADAVKPSATFANIPFGGLTSNSWFLLKGKSSDNVGVNNVFFNLNNQGWQPVQSDNNFTNWSAWLVLNPGTNTISITAADAAGNYSTPLNARMVYVLTAPITLNINGRGTINPSLNGSELRIGQRYSPTATPAVGYAFTGWTDSSWNWISTKPTLSFLMDYNLAFTANFADVAKPSVSIVAPNSRTSARTEIFTANGKSQDNVGVAGVWYRLNGGDWWPVTTANNYATWTATLDLTPGVNIFSTYAQDFTGLFSVTNTVKFVYATAPRTLNTFRALVSPQGQSSYGLSFGPNTFSEVSEAGAGVNGVGSYKYVQTSPTTAKLTLNFLSPPQAKTVGAQSVDLNFIDASTAQYAVNGSQGTIQFSSTPTLAMNSLAKQSMIEVNNAGEGKSTTFVGPKFVSTNLTTRSATTGTAYNYVCYSPISAMLKSLDKESVTYTMLTYLGTNNGIAYSERYNLGGNYLGSERSLFGFVSQQPGGNAPKSLASSKALVYSAADAFHLSFDNQQNFVETDSSSASVTNAIGTYNYETMGTNTGWLNLNFGSSPDVSSALLQFFAPNAALFTNTDNTVGAALFK